jgi:hypothetical protein
VLRYEPRPDKDKFSKPPRWSVVVVTADGTSREGLAEVDDAYLDFFCFYSSGATGILSKDFKSFGFRGTCYRKNVPLGLEAISRWDPARKMFVGGKWLHVPPARDVLR